MLNSLWGGCFVWRVVALGAGVMQLLQSCFSGSGRAWWWAGQHCVSGRELWLSY
jgi:hypothetical protein